CAPHRIANIAERGSQRLARTRELEQGVDEVRHQVHAALHFLVKLLALLGREVTVDQEFRIGDDGGERVAEVVGNGTGHTANRGQLLGLKQIALALKQTGAHAVESVGKFGHLVASPRIHGMVKITAFKGAHAGNQVSQRPGEGVGKEKYQPASYKNSEEAQEKQITIQLTEELRRLIVRPKHNQANRCGLFAGQGERSCQKVFVTHRDI